MSEPPTIRVPPALTIRKPGAWPNRSRSANGPVRPASRCGCNCDPVAASTRQAVDRLALQGAGDEETRVPISTSPCPEAGRRRGPAKLTGSASRVDHWRHRRGQTEVLADQRHSTCFNARRSQDPPGPVEPGDQMDRRVASPRSEAPEIVARRSVHPGVRRWRAAAGGRQNHHQFRPADRTMTAVSAAHCEEAEQDRSGYRARRRQRCRLKKGF